MNVSTKYNINQYVFRIQDNNIYIFEIDSISINCEIKNSEEIINASYHSTNGYHEYEKDLYETMQDAKQEIIRRLDERCIELQRILNEKELK